MSGLIRGSSLAAEICGGLADAKGTGTTVTKEVAMLREAPLEGDAPLCHTVLPPTTWKVYDAALEDRLEAAVEP